VGHDLPLNGFNGSLVPFVVLVEKWLVLRFVFARHRWGTDLDAAQTSDDPEVMCHRLA